MRRWLNSAMIGITALALASCSWLPLPNDADESAHTPGQAVELSSAGQQLADAVTAEALTSQLTEIERLTVDADGNRGPGSAGYLATAEWIESELSATGFYEVYRQDFTIQMDHPGRSKLTDEAGEVINQRPLKFSAGTPAEGLTGLVVSPASGTGCQASDWDARVTDQIAFAERGGCSFNELNAAAAEAGAAMVIVSNNDSGGVYGTLGAVRPDDIPMTGITRQAGDDLRERIGAGEVRLTFTFDQRLEEFQTFNLFAETTGGRSDNVVMAGAHLDGVPEGPGVNDNGSGAAALLEVALRLADGDQPANKVRFAWWSGEELGLLGAQHWLNSLVETDPQQISSLVTYLNVDMVASPNYVIGVYDGDGSTYPGEDLPANSDLVEAQFTGYFDTIGQPWTDAEMDGGSDHAVFMESGVPIGGLFTGADGSKTEDEVTQFGGERGRPYDSNYHQPSDLLENADLTALAINGKAIAYAVGALAADSAPINGDQPGNQGTPTATEGWGYAGVY